LHRQGNDIIYGGGGSDFIYDQSNAVTGSLIAYGGDGEDVLHGGIGGHNVFYGGAGRDSLVDERGGDNSFFGDIGDDIFRTTFLGTVFMDGGLGNDLLALSTATLSNPELTALTLDIGQGTIVTNMGTAIISSIEEFILPDTDDVVIGDENDTLLLARAAVTQ
jgi:Ca2+-binding RTX toxin-like protein